MTIALSIKTGEGLVFASGATLSSSNQSLTACTGSIDDHLVWAGAGDAAFVQRFQERIGSIIPDVIAGKPLGELRDHLAETVRDCGHELLLLDSRRPLGTLTAAELAGLHTAAFLFASPTEGPRVLRITGCGIPQWMSGACVAIGHASGAACALLEKYNRTLLTINQAQVLACKVISEACRAAGDTSEPIVDMWEATVHLIRRCSPREIREFAEAALRLRNREAELLSFTAMNSEVPFVPEAAASPPRAVREVENLVACDGGRILPVHAVRNSGRRATDRAVL